MAKGRRAAPTAVAEPKSEAANPRWIQASLLALAVVFCLYRFTAEIFDTDFWWHLKTGQYIVEEHALPVPDPFSYTSGSAPLAYAGEALTRHFNLTHEWLAQCVFYAVYWVAGFGGLVAFRGLLLTVFCALVGLVAYRRSGGFYRALAAAMTTAWITTSFALDRPFIFTFLFLALTLAILEYRRYLWLMPVLLLVWANFHGGYFLGLVVMGVYSAEALWLHYRSTAPADARMLWGMTALSALVSGLNPNGFRILQILSYYRASYLTSRLQEWAHPRWWMLSGFTVLLYGAAVILIWQWRRVRVADWLLFAAFAAAALSAQRNVILIGILAPFLIVSYMPWERLKVLSGRVRWLAPVAAAAIIGWGIASAAGGFQFRAAEWKYPSGAADFLLQHPGTGPIFNTYEYGGYLIWRLWPRERVFIDGRSLSETVFQDYGRILYNHDESGGKSAQELLDQYGIRTIVMNSFEYNEGLVYLLAPSLADPRETKWKLVYTDGAAMILMRDPPAGVEPLPSLQVLEHMEAECDLHLQHQPQISACAKSLARIFLQLGDRARGRRWLGVFLGGPHKPDPEVEDAYRKLLNQGI